jgi:hypothetical protein
MNDHATFRRARLLGLTLLMTAAAGVRGYAATPATIALLHHFVTVSSIVPANGDRNPYGVAQVSLTKGPLVAGRSLATNFNNASNPQGTGTTVVQIAGALVRLLAVPEGVYFVDDATNTFNLLL